MANVLHKTAVPVDYRESVNTPDFPEVDWFINPDISAVENVDKKYWARPLTDPVTEMTQAEKDVIDASEAAQAVDDARAEATAPIADDATSANGLGVRTRAEIEGRNKRDNYLVNRIIELQAALDAMKATSGNAQNIRDAIPASWMPTATRPRSDAIQDFRASINNGDVDAGE